jgi:hydroxyacylglutathione hydrolase
METRRTVAIIGGGVSGTLTAYHLLQQRVPADVVVIDPRAELGLGLAYSTPSLRHLLNVPAAQISALPEQPGHFLNWLRTNFDPDATENIFAPRAIFGRYIRSLLPAGSRNMHIRAEVVDYEPVDSGARLLLHTGEHLSADAVVLAIGNFDPARLWGVSEEVEAKGLYHDDAWDESTYEGLDPEAPVTLIGTGLTAVDVVLRLRELGHRGIITAVSRHGIFPSRHADYEKLSYPAIPASTPHTARAYLCAFRATLRQGGAWRAAIDSLRADTNSLWLALPPEEQLRFQRHLQRRWEVVRHRMAPPIADFIHDELVKSTLIVRKGRLSFVEAAGTRASVSIQSHGRAENFLTSRVINCTGPNMNYKRVDSPLLQSLLRQGLVVPGRLGTGLWSDATGALFGVDGQVSNTLFNLGPGRMGTLLESISVVEIRSQAVSLAARITHQMQGGIRAVVGAPEPASARATAPVSVPETGA